MSVPVITFLQSPPNLPGPQGLEGPQGIQGLEGPQGIQGINHEYKIKVIKN